LADSEYILKELDVKCVTEKIVKSWCQWLTSVILATQEVKIRRMAVQSQPRQIVRETLS
jgi:hypothetical protein